MVVTDTLAIPDAEPTISRDGLKSTIALEEIELEPEISNTVLLATVGVEVMVALPPTIPTP